MVSAGVNHLLPLDWLPRGVVLTNSSGVHSELAGQYAAGAVLALNFRVPVHATNQRNGLWDQVFNSPVGGKTVVLIGLGAIGGSAARQLRRLGLRVLGVRRSGRAHPHAHRVYRPPALPGLLPKADFVVVTAPLTPETRHRSAPGSWTSCGRAPGSSTCPGPAWWTTRPWRGISRRGPSAAPSSTSPGPSRCRRSPPSADAEPPDHPPHLVGPDRLRGAYGADRRGQCPPARRRPAAVQPGGSQPGLLTTEATSSSSDGRALCA